MSTKGSRSGGIGRFFVRVKKVKKTTTGALYLTSLVCICYNNIKYIEDIINTDSPTWKWPGWCSWLCPWRRRWSLESGRPKPRWWYCQMRTWNKSMQNFSNCFDVTQLNVYCYNSNWEFSTFLNNVQHHSGQQNELFSNPKFKTPINNDS